MTASSMAQQLPLQPNNNPSSGAAAAAAAALATTAASTRPQPAADQQGLRCPRCDSPNTKFCYYNNYSLTQPRHFCKSCRRYWTKGGALRNVPVGGGCRKPKRSRSSRLSSSPSSAAASSMQQLDPLARAGFDLSAMLPSYSYHPIPDSAFAAAAASSSSNRHLLHHGGGGGGGSIASSIQSLSSINQDLHWKLQQQRLHAMLAAAAGGGDRTQDSKGAETALGRVENHVNDVSLHGDHGDTTTTTTAAAAWFLDPYSVPNVNATNYHHSSATANVNNGSTSASDWIGIPTWSHDTHHFAAFP